MAPPPIDGRERAPVVALDGSEPGARDLFAGQYRRRATEARETILFGGEPIDRIASEPEEVLLERLRADGPEGAAGFVAALRNEIEREGAAIAEMAEKNAAFVAEFEREATALTLETLQVSAARIRLEGARHGVPATSDPHAAEGEWAELQRAAARAIAAKHAEVEAEVDALVREHAPLHCPTGALRRCFAIDCTLPSRPLENRMSDTDPNGPARIRSWRRSIRSRSR